MGPSLEHWKSSQVRLTWVPGMPGVPNILGVPDIPDTLDINNTAEQLQTQAVMEAVQVT